MSLAPTPAPLPEPDEITASLLVAMGWQKPFPRHLLWTLDQAQTARRAISPARLGPDALALVSAMARLAESIVPPA